MPDVITGLPLRLHEKLALHYLHMSSSLSNEQLACALSMQPRGVQDMLRRLRKDSYIESTGKGRKRQLWLTFDVSCGTTRPA